MEKYSVIYARPPWKYSRQHPPEFSTKEENYQTFHTLMSLDEILAFPIENFAEKDCILFLWATTPMLPEAIKVTNAWGFVYKTLFTWEKTNDGCMGYWFKTCTEHIIIATKGSVKAFGSNIRNCYHEPQYRNGRKPEYFYHLIEKLAKGAKKIELFAKRQRKGWDVWEMNAESTGQLNAEQFQ